MNSPPRTEAFSLRMVIRVRVGAPIQHTSRTDGHCSRMALASATVSGRRILSSRVGRPLGIMSRW